MEGEGEARKQAEAELRGEGARLSSQIEALEAAMVASREQAEKVRHGWRLWAHALARACMHRYIQRYT